MPSYSHLACSTSIGSSAPQASSSSLRVLRSPASQCPWSMPITFFPNTPALENSHGDVLDFAFDRQHFALCAARRRRSRHRHPVRLDARRDKPPRHVESGFADLGRQRDLARGDRRHLVGSLSSRLRHALVSLLSSALFHFGRPYSSRRGVR